MIISASYRTDIPAFYGDWFGTRLAAGWVEVKNPYSRQVSRVSWHQRTSTDSCSGPRTRVRS